MSLMNESCVTVKADSKYAKHGEVKELLPKVPEWKIIDTDAVPHLVRSFNFNDFASAMSFAVTLGAESDDQDHHPKITVEWGAVLVEWWTHSINGLHRNDFVMAARADRIYKK